MLGIGRECFALAVRINGDDLAVIAAGEDARGVACHTENTARMHGHALLRAVRRDEQQSLLAKHEHGTLAEKTRGDHRPAHRDRLGAINDGGDWAACVGHGKRRQATQLSKPLRIFSSGRFRPMNTMRLWRFSPSFHSRWWSPSSIMCTPWNTKRCGSSFSDRMPLERRMFGP